MSITWTGLHNVSVGSGNSISKINSTGFDGQALSEETISADGEYFSFIPSTVGTSYNFFGLSDCPVDSTNYGYQNIDYSFYTQGVGAKVYENGYYIKTLSNFSSNTVFKIALDSGYVKYYLDDTLEHTSSVSYSNPLRVDTCLYTIGTGLTSPTLFKLETESSNGSADLGDYYAMWNGRLILVYDSSGTIVINGTSGITGKVLGCEYYNSRILFWGTNENGTTQIDAYYTNGNGYSPYNKYR